MTATPPKPSPEPFYVVEHKHPLATTFTRYISWKCRMTLPRAMECAERLEKAYPSSEFRIVPETETRPYQRLYLSKAEKKLLNAIFGQSAGLADETAPKENKSEASAIDDRE